MYSVFTGVVAGVIAEGLFRAAGKAIKGKKPTKEFTEAGNEMAEAVADQLDAVRENPGAAKQITDTLPQPVVKEGAEEAIERPVSDLRPEAKTLSEELQELPDETVEVFLKIARGEDIKITDETIPFNLNKIRAPHQFKEAAFGVGKLISDKLPRNLKWDEEARGFAEAMGLDPQEYFENLQRVTQSVDEASKMAYVQGSKVMGMTMTKRALEAAKEMISNPTTETRFAANKAAAEATEALRAVSGLGTAFGRGLAQFKKIAQLKDISGQADMLRMDLVNRVFDVSEADAKKRLARMVKLGDKSAQDMELIRQRLLKEENLWKGRTPEQAARDILEADLTQLRAMNHYLNTGAFARTREALTEIYINGLLSSVKTFAINAVGNLSAITTSIFERAVAGLRGAGGAGEVKSAEAMLMFNSYWSSIADVPRVFAKAFREGPSDAFVKTDFMKSHTRALSKEAWGASGAVGQAIDAFGSFVNLPGKLLLSADEVFKHINFNAELKAIAYRRARDAYGKTPRGKAESLEFAQMVEKFKGDPDILNQATEFAKVNTFTNDLYDKTVTDSFGRKTKVAGNAKNFQRWIESDPTGFVRIQVPFFKTPVNLMRYAGNRVPFVNRFSAVIRDELRSPDPAIRQLAEAKAATGMMAMSTAMYFGFNGLVTGAPPQDPKMKKQMEEAGWQPYSIYNPFTGTYTSYNRFDPIGILLAVGANAGVLAKGLVRLEGHEDQFGSTEELYNEYLSLYADAAVSLGRVVTDRHYLKTFGLLVDAMQGDSYAVGKIFGQIETGINPLKGLYSSARRSIVRGLDPVREDEMRDPSELSPDASTSSRLMEDLVKVLDHMGEDTLKNWMPGYGKLPADRDLVGEVKYYPGAEANEPLWNMWNMLVNPFSSTKETKDPVLRALARLQVNIGAARDTDVIDGVELTNEEHDMFAIEWGKLNKQLGSIVEQKSFLNSPEQLQHDIVKQRILANRDTAKMIVKAKNPRIAQRAVQLQMQDMQAKTKGAVRGDIQGLFAPLNK
jgi:hypothetical protein